jgi:pimeloyl-ACP methyl ester carboxylesterase
LDASETTGGVLLVGSSLGAWLALLLAQQRQQAVIGLVLVGAAVDASRRWIHHLPLNEIENEQMHVEIPSNYVPEGHIRLHRALVLDANRNFLVLETAESGTLTPLANHPVYVLHGDADDVVPVEDVRMLAAVLPACILQAVPGGDHRLSRPADLELLKGAVHHIARLAGLAA